jgi:ribonuclease E
MDDERDLLIFTDDNGQEIQMEVVDYFEYEDEEYAVLTDADDPESDCDACCDDEEKDIYIMKVVSDGDTEEFIPVEEDKMDELIDVIQVMYEEDEEEEDQDDFEDEEDEEDFDAEDEKE